MKLSQKIQAMELSPIRKFVPYADAARAAGKKVYGLLMQAAPSFFVFADCYNHWNDWIYRKVGFFD